MKKTGSYSRFLVFPIMFLMLVISTGNGCKKKSDTPTPSPGANAVWMQNTAFNPTTITVAVNTTITWTNKDAASHTVTSTTGLFDSGLISSGGTYSRQFTTAGTYPYKCTVHPGMTGTVIVQ